MKNYNAICEEIKENYKKIHELDKQKSAASYSERNSLYNQTEHLEIVNKVLCNNSRRVLFTEIFPKVLNILGKYNNKPMGEKTKDKLRAEAKEALNCSIWFEQHYIHIIMLDDNGFSKCGNGDDITISTNNYNNVILDNNRLQVYSIDEYYLCDTRDYIDNIEEYLQVLSELKRKAKEVQENLESICSEYNALAVDKIEYLNYRGIIY